LFIASYDGSMGGRRGGYTASKKGSHKPQAAMAAPSTNFNQRTRVYLFEENRASFAGADAVFKKMQKKNCQFAKND